MNIHEKIQLGKKKTIVTEVAQSKDSHWALTYQFHFPLISVDRIFFIHTSTFPFAPLRNN